MAHNIYYLNATSALGTPRIINIAIVIIMIVIIIVNIIRKLINHYT